MPHIRVRGVQEKTVAYLSSEVQALANLIKTEADNFTFELVQTQFFAHGNFAVGYPFVEVLWFPRNQEIKQAVAEFITETLGKAQKSDYITVVFTDLEVSSYFENGAHFG